MLRESHESLAEVVSNFNPEKMADTFGTVLHPGARR